MYALITGASSGIGRDLAFLFAKDGIPVILTARRQALLESIQADINHQYGVEVIIVPIDLSTSEGARQLFDHVQSHGYAVSYLVNNAGFGHLGPFTAPNWEKYRQMMMVNMMAVTELSYLFSSQMKQSGFGRIMNVSSMAAFGPIPYFSVYSATKAFLYAFSEAINVELKPFGVTVTTLCPGVTQTGFQQVAEMDHLSFFTGRFAQSSKVVAQTGYEAMLKGQSLVITGLINKMMAGLSGFLPKKLIPRISGALMKGMGSQPYT